MTSRSHEEIIIVHHIPEHLRQRAVEIYFEAFQSKLGWVLGGKSKTITFLHRVMDPKFAICAIGRENGQDVLMGLAGYKVQEGCLVGGNFNDLVACLGFVSAIWRAPIIQMLNRKVEPTILLMDGIAVSSGYRGKGIGTRLLADIVYFANKKGYSGIRLDVINTNPRAKKLYERIGFKVVKTEYLGPFRYLFGFSSETQMLKTLAGNSTIRCIFSAS